MCLAVAQHLLQVRKRRWVRYARKHLRHLFPFIPQQSGYPDAGYGYCAAHSRFYWGLKRYLATTLEGLPVAWCLATSKLGEADVRAELLARARQSRALPEQVFLIGDKGFDGRDWHQAMNEFTIAFARSDKKHEGFKHGSLGGTHQRIGGFLRVERRESRSGGVLVITRDNQTWIIWHGV